MKEVKEILDRVSMFGIDERGVLATVVDLRGSGYRRPGARMLIMPDGETVGMVSGGCLESDVMERAKKVLLSGRAEVFTYDTTRDENSVFSLNMGCRGVIRILLEAIGRDSSLLQHLQAVREQRQHRSMATLISHDAGNDTELGGRLFLTADLAVTNDRLPRFLQDAPELRNELSRFHQTGSLYAIQEIRTDERSFEFAFESPKPPVQVLLFGAGADAVPFAKIASQLGWTTKVFDHRPAFLTKERFVDADQLVLLNREEPIEPPAADAATAAVIMTHNYEQDVRIFAGLLNSDVACIAALGPKRRTEQILDELRANGNNFTEEQMAKVYAPAGLDIGAETPEAIALSIAAEIQSVLRERGGGHLRDRNGPIYDRK